MTRVRRPATILLLAALALSVACRRAPKAGDQILERLLASPGPLTAASLSFVAIGDFGIGGGTETQVARGMQDWAAKQPVQAFVTTGDNIYPSGAPSSFQNAWHRPFEWVQRAGIPIVASLGNHDVRTDKGQPVMDLLDMPSRWYQKRMGPVQFLVLDSTLIGAEEQLTFIDRAIDERAPWTIAVFHHPAWSCGRHGTTSDVQRLWLPLFVKRGVDLILTGHDHDYQRFDTAPPAIVTGGGGASLYQLGRCPSGTPKPVASFVSHHFVAVDATPLTLRLRAVRLPGNVTADDATLTKAL